jgi:serine/threonine-protein kinase
MTSTIGIGPLITELRRRRVIRVALGYGAFAWIVIEVASTVLPILGGPDAAVRVITVLAVASFPPALVLAWVFDITRDGIRRTPHRDTLESAPPLPASTVPDRNRLEATETLRTIVALPFVDRSPDGDHRLLADGITEDLINGLARVPGLRVIARTTAYAVAAEDPDVRDVGARLGVGTVVEGSLRVVGDRMRLNVRLVRTADGVAVWSESFERCVDDLFAVQNEVATAIVRTLRRRLLAESPRGDEPTTLATPASGPIVRGSTHDLRAYTLYLRGRALWKTRSPSALDEAQRAFEEAIEIDPAFAQAYAGLADVHSLRVDYGRISVEEGLPPARRAAMEALRLGGDLAESHVAAAIVRQLEGAWRLARAEFLRALELNPGNEVARHRYALLLAWLGRIPEARRQIDLARELDPLSPLVTATVAWIEYYAGSYAEAAIIARDALAASPGLVTARVVLSLALLAAGRPADAVEELRAAIRQSGDAGGIRAVLVHALGRSGRNEEAAAELQRLRAGATDGYVSPYCEAVALLGTGDGEGALDALDRAVDGKVPQIVYLRAEPLFAPLASDSRFRSLLARADLVDPLRPRTSASEPRVDTRQKERV